ncbi:hypothetical protein BASA82_000756 [Batrachochytrium salamandrivorans]|nr:hypothetical protein BASA60_005548 [Batrachochytrium salamandrivorans]KAH6574863.1 hypothetical protein BASA62_002228 [Batrachochytrium salamandrivorans]KAH9262193.1 hypothetical protein BASA82_000756 [Batrachochytrium salamandrivorans]KAH9271755.1 hypothetical protein BASA83_006125 [Batrachochytrium salamandrivorans]
MVITSVNAGLLGNLFGDIKIHPIKLSAASSSTSNSISDRVKQQMEENPILDHMFNGDEEHNNLLIYMYTLQANFFDLMKQVKYEFSPHRAHVELNENPTQAEVDDALNSDKTDYQYIVKLLDKTYGCLNEFKSLMSRYLKKYLALPENSVILSFGYLQKTFELLREDLKLSSWM